MRREPPTPGPAPTIRSNRMFARAICRACKFSTLISDKVPLPGVCESCGAPFLMFETPSADLIARWDRVFLKSINVKPDETPSS